MSPCNLELQPSKNITARKLLWSCSCKVTFIDKKFARLLLPNIDIFALLRPGNTASFEEMSQWWRAVGNTVSDLTGPRFKPQTSRSRDKRVTARPTGRYIEKFGFLIEINSFCDVSTSKFDISKSLLSSIFSDCFYLQNYKT